MRRILFISALFLFLCVSSFVMAFDNHRYGFIIGGLGGIAVTTWDGFNDNEVIIAEGANITLHFNLRIGGGYKGDKFMLYHWFVVDLLVGENLVGENYDYSSKADRDLAISFITGPGVSYYFKPTSPSLYICSGIGFGNWNGVAFGVGAMGGIGYEFTRHWSVECGVIWSKNVFFDFMVNSLAISLSIIGIAY